MEIKMDSRSNGRKLSEGEAFKSEAIPGIERSFELTKEAFCLKVIEDTDDLLGRFHTHLNQIAHISRRAQSLQAILW